MRQGSTLGPLLILALYYKVNYCSPVFIKNKRFFFKHELFLFLLALNKYLLVRVKTLPLPEDYLYMFFKEASLKISFCLKGEVES